jgi:GT2 family glycosyltransferase
MGVEKVFKLKEYVARSLLYFDMRYNFIDSKFLRDNSKIPLNTSPREYWALVLFWKGIFPDKKFDMPLQEFGLRYNFLEKLGFRFLLNTLKFFKTTSSVFDSEHKDFDIHQLSKLDYSQLFAIYDPSVEIASKVTPDPTSEDNFVIVIPVFNAGVFVKKCLDSVLETTTSCEVLVVDDCSTDPETLNLLESLRSNSRIRIVKNHNNLGFVKSANIGFNHSQGKHVLLLNSDTIVFGNWLNRISKYFVHDPKAWTVTPLSNAATVFSVPFSSETSLNEEISRELDHFLSRDLLGNTNVVYAPTCHGFCVAIHRDALNNIGGFNETIFGKGYGEENDFSMRVIAAGHRNVIATDTLVHHFGSKSFGDEKSELSKLNMQALIKLHPTYLKSIRIFLEEKNFEKIRALSLIFLVRSKLLSSKLIISHALGGGVERSVQIENSKFDGVLIIASPRTNNSITLEFSYLLNQEVIEITGIESANLILAILDLVKPEDTQIDHVLGFPPEAIERFNLTNQNYTVRLHDYFYVCPRIHLSGTNNRDCKLPDLNTCTACLTRDFDGNVDIEVWRMRNISLLLQSKSIFASCDDVVNRYKKINKNLVISVSPVELPIKSLPSRLLPRDNGLTLCVLGHLNLNKGARNVEKLADFLDQTKSSMKIVHLGNVIGRAIKKSRNFESLGAYDDTNHLNLLLKDVRPDLFWFPSEVPETYSYTLSEALAFELPISYFDTGAIGERLQDYKWKIPFQIGAESSEIFAQISKEIIKFRSVNGA